MPEETKEEVKEEKEVKEEAPNSRREAIEKGIEEVDKAIKVPKEEKEVSKEEDSKEDEEDSKEDLDAAQREESENAVKLFRALNDPEQGPKILKMLAQEAGLLDKSATKQEQKVATKSIKEVVKEKLGTEYSFLADRIGEMLEELLPTATKEVSERLDAREKQELTDSIDSALADCFGQYVEIPKAVQTRFNELIDEMPPVAGKTNPKIYFNRLIKIAAEETNTSLKVKDSKEIKSKNELSDAMKERLKRNKNDATSNLASKGAEAEVETTSKSESKPPKSRREAIERAAKDVAAQMKG